MAIARLIDDLADFLVSKSIGLNKGANLWLGIWKDKPRFATLITDTGGVSMDPTFVDRDANGHINTRFDDRTVQVLTRAEDYRQAHDQQWKIYQVLEGRNGFTMGSFEVQGIEAMAQPQQIEGGDGSPFIVSTNYALLVRDDSSL